MMNRLGPAASASAASAARAAIAAASGQASRQALQETGYIEQVRREYYGTLSGMPAPLSEENFLRYGSSSSPTLVFIDRKGIVRLYHPGSMTYPELVAAANTIAGD